MFRDETVSSAADQSGASAAAPEFGTKRLITALSVGLRAGFFALLPGAAVAGGLAAAPLLAAAGAVSLGPSTLKLAAGARPAIWLMAAWATWATLSSLWSPYPDHGQAWRFAATLALGLAFAANPRSRPLTEAGGAAAVVVMAAMLAIEAFAGLPFNRAAQPEAIDWVLARNPGRGASMLVVLTWPVLGALLARGRAFRWGLAALVAAGGALISLQFDMDANAFAFAAGAAAFAFASIAPRVTTVFVWFGLAGWLLIAPLATPLLVQLMQDAQTPHSWAVRGEVWRFAIAKIQEQPLIGRGMDASRAFTETITVGGETMRAIPLHPHSASLQVWLETGAVGALLGVAALAAGGLTLARGGATRRRSTIAAACATLAAAGVLSNLSYGAWQEWWLATLAVGAALVASIPARAQV